MSQLQTKTTHQAGRKSAAKLTYRDNQAHSSLSAGEKPEVEVSTDLAAAISEIQSLLIRFQRDHRHDTRRAPRRVSASNHAVC